MDIKKFERRVKDTIEKYALCSKKDKTKFILGFLL